MQGMMWYANEKDISLSERISKAIAHYQAKYKSVPDLIFVSSNTMQEILNLEQELKDIVVEKDNNNKKILLYNIEVKEDSRLLKDIYWICEKNL